MGNISKCAMSINNWLDGDLSDMQISIILAKVIINVPKVVGGSKQIYVTHPLISFENINSSC